MTERRHGADILIASLAIEGVDVVFGVPGGAILKAYDALVDSGIRHILASTNTSYAEVAKLLGISKKTLWEKRKKYNLDEQVEEMEA